MEVVLVTGMSGAGRSTAAQALEDLGWFVIDNLPPNLITAATESLSEAGTVNQVGVVIDIRGGTASFVGLVDEAKALTERGVDCRIVFLESDDQTLVRRFESSRRPHPLKGHPAILESIQNERALLSDVREYADVVIDTSNLNVHDLRRRVEAAFEDEGEATLRATVMSFGFKYGIPVDADLVADMRFLPNPYWDPELRDKTGLDPDVSDYVTAHDEAREFLDIYTKYINLVADGYIREGKRYLTIAVGCTGGKHRSVAMSENLAARLVREGVETLVYHRDLGRE